MAAGATTIPTVSAALAGRLETIAGLTVIDHEPRDVDPLPSVTLGLPRFERVDLDQPEFELGSTELKLYWPFKLYVRLDDPQQAALDALALLGQILGVIDADQTLGGAAGVRDTKLTRGDPGFTPQDASSQMLIYTCELACWLLVSY